MHSLLSFQKVRDTKLISFYVKNVFSCIVPNDILGIIELNDAFMRTKLGNDISKPTFYLFHLLLL